MSWKKPLLVVATGKDGVPYDRYLEKKDIKTVEYVSEVSAVLIVTHDGEHCVWAPSGGTPEEKLAFLREVIADLGLFASA